MLLHSAAILTVLCFFVLPSRSGSRTLGIKDTYYYYYYCYLYVITIVPIVRIKMSYLFARPLR